MAEQRIPAFDGVVCPASGLLVEGAQVGAYRVLQQIGRGGMGSVWLAEHIALGRRAALKVLHPEFSRRPDIVNRFFNEARAAAMTADPGIVQIFDFGHHEGRSYIVMELLEGEPLDRRLEREGPLDVRDALRIMRQVATTLGAAHALGVVHRDLKPENIYIVRDPEVPGGERAKVLDFGIAKLIADPVGAMTQTLEVLGTPTFMSPEQCRSAGDVDQRSDIYALGCVLCTVITGRPPFLADCYGELIAMHLCEAPPAPSQLRPGIPREIDRLVLRCLAKDPAQRFPTAGELATAIEELLDPGLQAPRAARASSIAAPEPIAVSGATRTSAPPVKRSRAVLITPIVALLIVGVAVAAATTRHAAHHTPARIDQQPGPSAHTSERATPLVPVLPPAPAPSHAAAPEPIRRRPIAKAPVTMKSRSDAKPPGWTKSRPPAAEKVQPPAVEKPWPPARAPDGADGVRTKPAPPVELDDSGLPITR